MFLLIEKISEIIADMSGNDSVNPTPAPVRIAPINIKSKIILKRPDCFFSNIPEKVNGEFGLLIKASANAIAGRQ